MTMAQLLLLIMAAAIFLASLVALASFAVQLIILSLTERRFRLLRWVTLAAPALALGCGILAESAVWLGAAVSIFLGWGLAWLVCNRIRGRGHPPEPGPGGKTPTKRDTPERVPFLGFIHKKSGGKGGFHGDKTGLYF